MKSSLVIKSSIFVIAAFTASYLFYRASGDSLEQLVTNSWQQWHGKDQIFLKAVSFQDIDRIEINASQADVRITQLVTPGKLEFAADKDNQQAITLSKNSHTLTISVSSQDKSIHSLALTLPQTLKIIKLTTTTGDVQANYLQLNELTINTDKGDVICRGEIQQLGITTNSGDVLVRSSFATPRYKIVTNTGDISISFSTKISAQVTAKSESGNVVVGNIERQVNEKGYVWVKSIKGNILVQ